jgi:hypothetical protein
MYAHMSLLRTAFESALLAYWLFEPGIDAVARHARAIAALAEEYDERPKFEESWAEPLRRLEASWLSTGWPT